jgi:uncharacterized protein YlbG (UPF0298 family)
MNRNAEKLEKESRQLWASYTRKSPEFWKKYEALLATAKAKTTGRTQPSMPTASIQAKANQLYWRDLKKVAGQNSVGIIIFFGLIVYVLWALLMAKTPTEKAISNAARSHILFLDHQQLEQFPAKIKELKYLSRLYINHNQLKTIPNELNALTHLEVADFQSNQLQRLPQEMGGLWRLKILYLQNNQLTALPLSFSDLENLEDLDLSSNRLRELPDDIGKLKNLRILDVSDNQLTELPASIGQLKYLEKLILDNNQIKSLPEQIKALPKLKVIGTIGKDYNE